jgi:hypothetical protein
MPNRTPAIGTAMAPVSMNFGPPNCGAAPRASVEDKGAARMIEDYYTFQQWVLIFEQSVNHRRGPRSGRKLARLRRGFCLQFHATTAYDILRSTGVNIGKRDYLGLRPT